MTLATQQGAARLLVGHSHVRVHQFLKPVLSGIGVAVCVQVMLAMLLVALMWLVPVGESAGEEEGDSDGGEDVLVLDANDGGSASTDDSADGGLPRELDTGPVEITNSATVPIESPPAQAAATRQRTRPRRKEDLAPFVIASLPGPGSENRADATRSGQGFSDVEERLGQAGAKSGDVQISLAWNNVNDLDLHVVAPSGETISYQSQRSRCHGMLDVDMNAGTPSSSRPVENIFWPTGQAPKGEFTVIVHHYSNHGGMDPTRYQVIVKVDGKTRKFSGAVTSGEEPETVHRYTRQ
jgi:hypothetical protein